MIKRILILASIALLTACGSMKEIENRKTYAEPSWYQDCQQAGTSGWFWWKKEMAYACGGGISAHSQAADEQMYAVAMNNFAKRINGKVDSETKLEFIDDRKKTYTKISYVVEDTTIAEHVKTEKAVFTMNGQYYTFVRLEMTKAVFDKLVAEAKAQKVSKQQASR